MRPNFSRDRIDRIQSHFGWGQRSWICQIFRIQLYFDRSRLSWISTWTDSAKFQLALTRLNIWPRPLCLDLWSRLVHPDLWANPTKNLVWKFRLNFFDFSYLKGIITDLVCSIYYPNYLKGFNLVLSVKVELTPCLYKTRVKPLNF